MRKSILSGRDAGIRFAGMSSHPLAKVELEISRISLWCKLPLHSQHQDCIVPSRFGQRCCGDAVPRASWAKGKKREQWSRAASATRTERQQQLESSLSVLGDCQQHFLTFLVGCTLGARRDGNPHQKKKKKPRKTGKRAAGV